MSELLRLTRLIITQIDDDNGPAFENAVDLAEKCEASIKELDAQRMLANSLRFTKRLEKESLKLRDQA